MKYYTTKEEIRNDHVYYLKRIALTLILSLTIFTFGYNEYVDSKNSNKLIYFGVLSVIFASVFLVGILRNYFPVIKFRSEQDYLEIVNDQLKIICVKKDNEVKLVDLSQVKLFNHYNNNRPYLELIFKDGGELVINECENFGELVKELKASPAGKEYKQIL